MDDEARRTVLERKLRLMFPERHDRTEANLLLGSYGVESYEREAWRVRLAILKVAGESGGADVMGEVRRITEQAKCDYRDVLSEAEYPEQIRSHARPDEAMVRRDLAQYERWLES